MADIAHLVGRDAELTILQHRLEDVLRGRGVLVLISGEAGIGKTSLAQAVVRQAQKDGAAAAVGCCYEGTAPAFGLWQDLLDDLALSGVLDPSVLPQPLGRGSSAQTAYQLMQSVVGGLRSAVVDRALVLLLDDLHWADQDSLELLDLVTRRLQTTSILVIATFRSEDVHRQHPLYDFLPRLRHDRPVEDVTLRRLDQTATSLIATAACGPCSPQLTDSLHARSQGNPFILIELLRDFSERQTLAHAEQVSTPALPSVGVPVTLRQIVVRRITRLGEDSAQLLQVAAVVGEEWDLGVVEAVLGWPEERLLQALEAALEAQVVVPTAEGAERYRFSHGLICEVLYTEQVVRRRIHVHERVAAVLEGKTASTADQAGHNAALARHFRAAEQWVKALQYAIAAGDTARGRYASRSALQLYEQALEITHRLPDIDPAQRMALWGRLGQVRMGLNLMEAAQSDFQQMVRAAQAEGDRTTEGSALLWLSFVQIRLSRMKEAREAGDAAVELARQTSDERVLASSHWNLGRLHLASAEFEPARRHLDEAERLAREKDDGTLLSRCLTDQARRSLWRGEYERAEGQIIEAQQLASLGHDSLFLAGVYWTLGFVRGERGHYSSALATLHQGLAYASEVGDLHYPAKLLNTLGWLHAELGDPEAALRLDQQALQAAHDEAADRIREAECYCLVNLATDKLQLGDVQGAEQHLHELEVMDRGIEYMRFRYLNRSQLVRSQLALARQDPESALAWAGRGGRLAAANGGRKNLAKSRLLAGEALIALQRPDEAVAELRRSVALADELIHGSLRWLARLQLARAYAAAHRSGEAATLAHEAQALVEDVAAGLDDDLLRQTSLQSARVHEVFALAAELGRPVSTRSYPAGLTAREVEVLRLIAQGATNKEIAATLFISVKTVNAHLNSIFSKVDCRNRAAAAAFAFRHGLV